jgi:6-phosphofructokinase 1
VQRGGAPTAFDRLLATRLGAAAVECIARGERDVIVGLRDGQVATTDLAEVVTKARPLDNTLQKLATSLAR